MPGEQDFATQRLKETLQKISDEGGHSPAGISLSLQVELLSSLGALNERIGNAENQRIELSRKIDTVLDKINPLPGVLERLQTLETEQKLNTEFRLRFLGGSALAKLIWLTLGGTIVGGIIWMIQHNGK